MCSGLSSGLDGTETATCRRAIRTAAMIAWSTCGMCSSTSGIVTTSKESSGKGCSHMSRRASAPFYTL